MIKSISYSQEEILEWIISLYVDSGKLDCDPTFSKGVFYKGKIERPNFCFDINPVFDYVKKSDVRNLPIEDNTLKSIIFDPPFLATVGPSLKKADNSNIINKRFGVYKNERELHTMYVDALKELYRILDVNGILIFKCQDKNSSGIQYFSHCFVYNYAISIGFYPKDLFVLLAKNRIVADWQKRNQKTARKFHSYFWVLEKKKFNHLYNDSCFSIYNK